VPIEITTFRLNAETDTETFRALDQRAQVEFYYQQPGLIRRTTAVDKTGRWVTITHWDSDVAASVAASAAATAMVGADAGPLAEMIALIMQTSVESTLYSTV
jgi:hypothetical protein